MERRRIIVRRKRPLVSINWFCVKHPVRWVRSKIKHERVLRALSRGEGEYREEYE